MGSVWPDKAEPHELVERFLPDCDPADLADLADMANPADPTVPIAVRFAEDYKVAAFVADQKPKLCIAPSTAPLCRTYSLLQPPQTFKMHK